MRALRSLLRAAKWYVPCHMYCAILMYFRVFVSVLHVELHFLHVVCAAVPYHDVLCSCNLSAFVPGLRACGCHACCCRHETREEIGEGVCVGGCLQYSIRISMRDFSGGLFLITAVD